MDDERPSAKERLAACAASRLIEASGFATGVAVLQDDPVSGADGQLVHGLEPVVGQQPADEPGFEHEAHSRVELLLVDEACSGDGVLLPETRPADEVHSQVEPLLVDEACLPGGALLPEAQPVDAAYSQVSVWSPGRSLDEVCSRDEAHSPSQTRWVDEAQHCA